MMELIGTITGLQRDFKSGDPVVLLQAENNIDAIDDLLGKKLRVVMKVFRQGRSNDANAYFHVLVDKISHKTGQPNSKVKNHLLSEYGQRFFVDGMTVLCYFPDCLDVSEDPKNHFAPTGGKRIIRGRWSSEYELVRGSHTYDTKEMSQLIDGAVAEAKDLGIETMTPDELKKLYSAWKEAHG